MNTQLKRRITFALSMGVVTTGIISFTIIALNLGFSDKFLRLWLRSWGTAYAIVIPVILLISPRVQGLIDRLIPLESRSPSVLLTHVHADHVAGLRNADGKRKFPNATVSMLQADRDFWLSKEIAAKAPPEAKEFFGLAQASAKPYQAAGQWKPIAPGEEIVPGVRSLPIVGHNPGHTGYEITSNGQSLLIVGDTVHAAQIQLERPDIGVAFDIDGAAPDKSP